MKKTIILFAFILIGYAAQSQVIDTTVTSITACKVQPFKAKYTDTLNTTHVGMRLISDDLKSSATTYWQLLDSKGNMVDQGNFSISGNDYKSWSGATLELFVMLGNALKITFVK